VIPRLRRDTARVLPVDREGRVLLQLGRELHRRRDRFWLTIGGGAVRGETLAEAGAREMREEAGMEVDPAALGEPIGTTVIEYSAFALLPVTQYQTYFAIAVDDTVDSTGVSFAHQSMIERLTIERHEWLSADELEDRPERFADPAMPRMMRAAVVAARARQGSG
jgi:8-oxo-dGTP pyrophosphatase MutT (NUDIX family)